MDVLNRTFPLVLGTATFGSAIPASDALRLLDVYVAAGGNHLDTAHDYASWLPDGDGASERTIGAWLRHVGGRERLLIATKAGCTRQGQKRIRREILRSELALSLVRLGVASVDVFWLHRDDPAVPVADILDWLDELRREGLFIAAGASNWSTSRLDEAQALAKVRGVPGFFASQCGYNLATLAPAPFPWGDARFLEPADVRWHEQTRFPLFAYESQAGGFFSGRYRAGCTPSSPRGRAVLQHYGTAANWWRLEIVQEIARAHAATANQVALAWLRQQAFPIMPVIGPSSTAQLEDSLDALRLTLSPDEMARIAGEEFPQDAPTDNARVR
jgi:aryl-alcohol dehydrogenase-like predicted oxidoreductase